PQAHVDHGLRDLRHSHHVREAELLAKRRHHVGHVPSFEAVHLSTTPLHFTQYRTRRPSSSRRRPMRVRAPHSGQISWTFDACSDASRSTMPPLMLRWGLGRVWRLMKFTPSTMTRPL